MIFGNKEAAPTLTGAASFVISLVLPFDRNI